MLFKRKKVRIRGEQLWERLEEGQIRKGAVKSLADFGAFVDLGGVEGFLHLSDMSWGHVQHPSEIFKIGDRISVKISKLDKKAKRVNLDVKQLTDRPWENTATRYPPGRCFEGKVANVMSYGIFVQLEPGMQGLVHISEMYPQVLHHPSELASIGDTIEVRILKVDEIRQEMALSMKPKTNFQNQNNHRRGDLDYWLFAGQRDFDVLNDRDTQVPSPIDNRWHYIEREGA